MNNRRPRVNTRAGTKGRGARWLGTRRPGGGPGPGGRPDRYAQQAQQEGYRSRASYKLLEIHAKDRLFRPGMTVADLGAAPGGWSQVAARLTAPGGAVVAADILPMEPIQGVRFIQGDFTGEDAVREMLAAAEGADLVMSDMAPNMSGTNAIDQPRAMLLAERALELACGALRPGGDFLCKAFQGEGFDEWLQTLRGHFARVQTRKPGASRPQSRETYQLARGFKG